MRFSQNARKLRLRLRIFAIAAQSQSVLKKNRNRSAIAIDFFNAQFFANCELRAICDFSQFAICDFLYSAIWAQFVIFSQFSICDFFMSTICEQFAILHKLRAIAIDFSARNFSQIANSASLKNCFLLQKV